MMRRNAASLAGGAAVALAITAALTGSVLAQDGTLPDQRVGSVTYGPYVRFEAGMFDAAFDDALWQSGRGDPVIGFDLDGDLNGLAAIALGYDWQNGIRVEGALLRTGRVGLDGPCASASNGSPCSDHADITDGSFRTTAAMANVYFAPFEARGSNAVFQPFLVAGVGFAHNELGDWTRTNPSSNRPVRTFEGGSDTDLAWSVGLGASLQVTRPGAWPVIVDAAWRYYDFGSVAGGSAVLAGGGRHQPVRPLEFDTDAHVFSIGIRIPLQRY